MIGQAYVDMEVGKARYTYFVAVPVPYFCRFSIHFSAVCVDIKETQTGERFGINIIDVGEADMGERCGNIPFLPVTLLHVPAGSAPLRVMHDNSIRPSFLVPVVTLESTLT